MSLTVSGMAQAYYQSYQFTQTDSGKNLSSDEADYAKTNYHISDLSAALESLDSTGSVYGITNLAGYVNSKFLLSQSSVSDTLSALSGSGSFTVGNLSQTIAMSELMSKLGLDTDSPVNLNGLLTVDNAASLTSLTSAAKSVSSGTGSAVSSYERYLDANSAAGTLFDSKG